MENIFDFADELGPIKVVHVYEPKMTSKPWSSSTTSPAARPSAASAWRPT